MFGRETAEGEHAVLFDDEVEVLGCAFGFEQFDDFWRMALMRLRISSSSAIHCAFKSASFNTRAMVFRAVGGGVGVEGADDGFDLAVCAGGGGFVFCD